MICVLIRRQSDGQMFKVSIEESEILRLPDVFSMDYAKGAADYKIERIVPKKGGKWSPHKKALKTLKERDEENNWPGNVGSDDECEVVSVYRSTYGRPITAESIAG